MLDEFSVFLLIQFENVLKEYLEWIIGIVFEAPDYLRLKTEVLAEYEVITNI